ncbi:MAG: hypothetical protein PHI19_04840 [Clostridia bacterium]|nr:hypothetical protein [Clostridia bacterium]
MFRWDRYRAECPFVQKNTGVDCDKVYFKKLSHALHSKWFVLACLLFATLVFAFNIEVAGIVLFILLVSVILIVERDIMPTYAPLALAAMSVLRMYDSFDIFINYVWVIVVALISLVFHFLYYPPRRLPKEERWGKLFYPYLAVSLALILGGIGIISIKEYFNATTLYYILGLGVGMLIAYEVFRYYVNPLDNYDTKEYLSFIMAMTGAFAVIMVALQYSINVAPALLGPPFEYNIIERFFSMSNNVATYILMVSPFSFYLAMRKKYGIVYFVLGVLQGFAMLLSTSRSGFFFSFALILPLIVLTIWKDRAKRKQYFIALAAIALVFAGIFAIGHQKIWMPIYNNYAFDLSADWKIYLALAIGSTLVVSYFIWLYMMPSKLQKIFVPATLTAVVIFVAVGFAFWDKILPLLIRADESRGLMANLAITNFPRYPIFGTGIGYTGIEEFYQPRTATMHFYHSAPFQILGSMGLIGVATYGYMLFSRIKMLRQNNKEFQFTVYLCTLGLYLMSLVNPGIFVPLMFMLQLTLYYAIVERTTERKEWKRLPNSNLV